MTTLGRVTTGHLKDADFSGVANGTDLHGLQHWTCYRSVGTATGLFNIQSGEIQSTDTVSFAMALWGDPAVAHTGQCIRGQVMSPNWASLVLGFCADGALDHSADLRGFLGNTWELASRSGITDYGEGFSISSGTTPGQPLTNGTYYDFLMAAVQNPLGGGTHPRGGSAYGVTTLLAFNDTDTGLSSGINDGSTTYPGVYYFAAAGARWRNIKVYRDYRITVKGLSGTMAFRLYDSLGAVLYSSGTQSGGEAHVNVHLLSWPITGYLQVFSTDSYAIPLPQGRYPTLLGNATDLTGGDVFDQVPITGISVGIQINWDDSQDTPDHEWAKPGDDVTADLVDLDLSVVAANPRIEVDTLTIVLNDPTGKYVPANIHSSLYPNVRLARECRAILTVDGTSACRFYGTIAEYQPLLGGRAGNTLQQCQIRAESPLRAFAASQVQLTAVPSGVLVSADGTTGVIPTLLALVPDILPASTWALDPTPDSVTDGFLTVGMTVQTALEQCAIFADSIYLIRPVWKQSTLQPNFQFVWKARGITQASFADHVWTDTGGDIGSLIPRYTGDVI